MKNFDEKFRTQLYHEVSNVESHSQAEIVVIIKPFSGNYTPWIFVGAAAISFIVLSVMMFIPLEIDPYTIYYITILGFIIGLLAFKFIKPLLRLIIPTKILQKNTEIYARASFQKGHMYNTGEHSGFLAYCSVFEKQTFLVADWGLAVSVPEKEMAAIENKFAQIFKNQNPAQYILECLKYITPIFAEFMPHRDDDINELPDDLDVDL